jgi:hypothetical protein
MSSDHSGDRLPSNRPPMGPPGPAGGEHLAGEREQGAGHEEWFMPFIPADQPPGPGQRPRDRAPRRRVAWYIPLVGGCLTLLTLLMAAGVVLAGVASTLTFEKAAPERRQFAVNGTPTVVVDGTLSDLRVVTGVSAGANQVVVQATKYVHGFSSRRDERDPAQIPLTMEQSGDTVTIRPQLGHDPNSFTEGRIDLTVTVPARTNLTIKLSAGDVHLDGITGVYNVELDAGDLRLTRATVADGSTLRVASGDLHFDAALAADASVNLSVGNGDVDVTLPSTTNTHLDASTNAGDVRVRDLLLQPSASFTNASVVGDLGPQPSGTLTVSVEAGDITVGVRARSGTSPPPTTQSVPLVPPVPPVPPLPPVPPDPPVPPARPTR